MNSGVRTLLLPVIVTAVVATAVTAAIVMLGGPSVQRRHKMDEVRVQNLTVLSSSVNGYFGRHKELPADLGVLAKEAGFRISRSDPDTGRPYEYQVLNATSYRLCADFGTDSAADAPEYRTAYVNMDFAHGAGHQCFERNIDKVVR